MAEAPETRFATTRSGDHVAYQVIGEGPVQVLVTRPTWFSIESMWDEPRLVHFLSRLSSFSRHIWFDPRGTGASDANPKIDGRLFETLVEDMVTVIDDVTLDRVALLQLGGPGPAVLFAATHPARTAAAVLFNESARLRGADDYPEGYSGEIDDRMVAEAASASSTLEFAAPSLVGDARFRRWFERAMRLMCPPNDRRFRTRTVYEVDLRAVLQSVQAPTLVVHRRDVPLAAQARYVADHIGAAQFVEIDGADRLFFAGHPDALLDAIEEFLTGQLPPARRDRVLATVLFTDLVNSTPLAARMGDRRWRELLATHDTLIREELDRFRGSEIKSTGDGILATFDGPARAVRCACAIRDDVSALGMDVRAGVHTGEIELRGSDIAGIAVHIGQRVAAHAGPGEVLVSRTVADLIAGSDIQLVDRGEHELKGVPGTWRLFSAHE